MKKSPVALGIVWGYTAAVLAVLMCGCSERQEETSPDTVRKEAASLVQIIAKHGQGEFARRVREESRGVPPEQCVGMLLAILTDPAYAAPLRSPDAIPAEHPFDLRHNRSRMLGFCIRQLYALAFLDYVRNQRSRQTPMHIAAAWGSRDSAQALLNAGANTTAQDATGATPLHTAAENGSADIVRLLLQAGHANPEARDHEGNTPMHRAAAAGFADMVELLQTLGAAPSARNSKGLIPADLTPKNEPNTALQQAAKQGDIARIRQSLDEGAEANTADTFGRTPLHAAASRGHSAAVQLLLSAGADARAADNAGRTPAHAAAQSGHADCLRALLSAGADPNAQDIAGETPMHEAAEMGHTACLDLLLTAGASPAKQDSAGNTPLTDATRTGTPPASASCWPRERIPESATARARPLKN